MNHSDDRPSGNLAFQLNEATRNVNERLRFVDLMMRETLRVQFGPALSADEMLEQLEYARRTGKSFVQGDAVADMKESAKPPKEFDALVLEPRIAKPIAHFKIPVFPVEVPAELRSLPGESLVTFEFDAIDPNGRTEIERVPARELSELIEATICRQSKGNLRLSEAAWLHAQQHKLEPLDVLAGLKDAARQGKLPMYDSRSGFPIQNPEQGFVFDKDYATEDGLYDVFRETPFRFPQYPNSAPVKDYRFEGKPDAVRPQLLEQKLGYELNAVMQEVAAPGIADGEGAKHVLVSTGTTTGPNGERLHTATSGKLGDEPSGEARQAVNIEKRKTRRTNDLTPVLKRSITEADDPSEWRSCWRKFQDLADEKVQPLAGCVPNEDAVFYEDAGCGDNKKLTSDAYRQRRRRYLSRSLTVASGC